MKRWWLPMMLVSMWGMVSEVHASEDDDWCSQLPPEAIDVTLGRGEATMRVRTSFTNWDETTDQIDQIIELPSRSALTGLRIAPLQPSKHRWFSGQVMEAREAADLYGSLTGHQGTLPGMAQPDYEPLQPTSRDFVFGRPRDPGLAVWMSSEAIGLQLAPSLPTRPRPSSTR